MSRPEPRQVAITGEMIRLGQLLKLSGLAATGSDAKALLATGTVLVNGVSERRRGRQLGAGDSVEATGERVVIVGRPA